MGFPATGPTSTPHIAALASGDPAVAGAAKAALAARGPEAVPLLLSCLDAETERLRLRAISLLSLLADGRAARPLTSLLHDPTPAIRQRAAGALARFPFPEVVSALGRLVEREKETSVRLVAVRSLVRLIQTGHDHAFRPLLDRLGHPQEEPRIRTAAMEALPWITRRQTMELTRGLLTRLAEDPCEAVARKARRMLASPARPRLEPWAIDKLLKDLAGDRLGVWRRALALLGLGGSAIVEPVIQAILKQPQDQGFIHRCTLVLKELPPRSLARLGVYLEVVREPAPLEALVDLAAGTGSRVLLVRLASLIRSLAEAAEEDGRQLDLVRQKAHLALAKAGSRLGVDDLRRLLEDRRVPVRPELAEAVAIVGTRRELPALVRGFRRSRGVARLALRDSVLAVARREKIRRTDRCFSLLEPAERRAALEILGPARRPGRMAPRLGTARIDRTSDPLLP